MMNRWILGSANKDIGLLFLPGFLTLILALIWPPHSQSLLGLVILFLAKAFADSGHVYTTVWRTYLNPTERKSNRIYIWAPIFFFVFCLLCLMTDAPYFWSFIVYATLFHNFRQLYGVNKWYRKINSLKRPVADFFLQILCVWPIVCYHFRGQPAQGYYYDPREILSYPSQTLYSASTVIYFALLVAWVASELLAWRKDRRVQWGYLSSFLLSITMYGLGFFFGKTVEQIILPLIVAHGIAYQALMAFAMNRTQNEKFALWSKAFFYVALTAFFFGGFEFSLENDWWNFKASPTIEAVVTAVILTALLCHYYFDMFLWKAKHREASQIFV